MYECDISNPREMNVTNMLSESRSRDFANFAKRNLFSNFKNRTPRMLLTHSRVSGMFQLVNNLYS